MRSIAVMLHAPRWQAAWRACAIALAVVIAGLALTPTPPPVPGLPWDKAQHALAFAALAAAGRLSARNGPRPAAWWFLGCVAYGAAIELAQLRVPGRSGEVADVLADAVGAVLGLGAATLARRLWPLRV